VITYPSTSVFTEKFSENFKSKIESVGRDIIRWLDNVPSWWHKKMQFCVTVTRPLTSMFEFGRDTTCINPRTNHHETGLYSLKVITRQTQTDRHTHTHTYHNISHMIITSGWWVQVYWQKYIHLWKHQTVKVGLIENTD